MLSKVYDLFYFMINFGSCFSSIITPWTLVKFGPTVAFGIPGILMFIATFIFWAGRNSYVKVPPSGPDPDSFWSITFRGLFDILKFGTANKIIAWLGVAGLFALLAFACSSWGLSLGISVFLLATVAIIALFFKKFNARMEVEHPKKRVEEYRIALGIAKVYVLISFFWALFDQHASTWVLQAQKMNQNVLEGGLTLFGYNLWDGRILPSQVQAINPVLVMMIPIFTYGIYPYVGRFYEMTLMRRFTWGFFVAAIGFATVGLVQYPIDGGADMNILWQVVPYILMTAAEILISITGLTFSYTQAPKSMKSIIMSFWLLSVFFGNIIAGAVVHLEVFPQGTGNFFMFFAFLIFMAGFGFKFLTRNYKMRDIMEA